PPSPGARRSARSNLRPRGSGSRTPSSRHGSRGCVWGRHLGREDVRQNVDVDMAARLLEPRGAFGAEDVESAVQQPPAIRDLVLLLLELRDELLEIVVGKRAQIWEGVHESPFVRCSARKSVKHSYAAGVNLRLRLALRRALPARGRRPRR